MPNRILTTLLSGAVSLGLLASAQAQTRCTSPTDAAAFEVGALKSELTVLAIDCRIEENYNRFVERYRSELVARDGVVNAWFKRAYGSSAQRNYDAYITLLANEQSVIAQHEGTDFCPRMTAMFAEVMALPDASVLAQYAAAKDVVPAEVSACVMPQVAAGPASRRPTGRRR